MKGTNRFGHRMVATALALGASAAMLQACNGLFEGIYDRPGSDGYGFIATDDATGSGTIRVDASDYASWVYIDLHARRTATAGVGAEEPRSWDFAVHRYDAKTAGGSVVETGHTTFDALRSAGAPPRGDYVADIWTTDRIAVDMAHMMEGRVVYAESYYNPELSKWLDVDTGTMPPSYTASNRIYLLRMQDGTCAALRLTGYMDDAGVKGRLTIDYIYPFTR